MFEDSLLTAEVLRVLRAHANNPGNGGAAQPWFIFWAPHLVHMPLQVPQEYLQQFATILNEDRRRMHAMVHYLDAELGTVVRLTDFLPSALLACGTLLSQPLCVAGCGGFRIG